MKLQWMKCTLALLLALTLGLPTGGLAEEPSGDAKEVVSAAVDAAVPDAEDFLLEMPEGEVAELAPFELSGDDAGAESPEDWTESGDVGDDEPEIAMTAEIAKSGTSGPRDYIVTRPITRNSRATLNVGDTLTLVMAERVRAYRTENRTLATVTAAGKISALRAGTVSIVVTLTTGRTITIRLTIIDPWAPTGVRIAQGAADTLYMGRPGALTAVLTPACARTTLTWRSSDAGVVRVSADGALTPVRVGTARVTVTTANGQSAGITLTVRRNVRDNITACPTAAQIRAVRRWSLRLKSVEILSNGRIACQFYLINNLGSVKYLRNLNVRLYFANQRLASHTFPRVNVTAARGQAKVFTVTFPANSLVGSAPILPGCPASEIRAAIGSGSEIAYTR